MDLEAKHVHFIGIGGSGISAIARLLLQSGVRVSGSDRQRSALADALAELGAQVYVGHRGEYVRGADVVVRSSAVPDDNPEVQAAKDAGIPVLKRADFLMRVIGGKTLIAVAGTHGKTTTTSMIAWMLNACGKDPSYIIGGVPLNLGENAHAGGGDAFVIEADEYDRMFLGLRPYISVVTNVEHDHPDCYPTPHDFMEAFVQFARGTARDGRLLVCAEDAGAQTLLDRLAGGDVTALRYGFRPGCDFLAENLAFDEERGGFGFDFVEGNGTRTQVRLCLPGEHNVLDAAAAMAAAALLDLPRPGAAAALGAFRGTGRRFELRGTAAGVTIIDDYAHHPTEIRATLAAARQRFRGRKIWAVWQPHTFSRTRTLFDAFASSFGDADALVITDVFAAREPVPHDFSAAAFVPAVQAQGKTEVCHTPSLDEAHAYLLANLRSGDVLIVLSAGDAERVSKEVLKSLQVRCPAKSMYACVERTLGKRFGERLQYDVLLERYSTMHTGGPADALLHVRSADEMSEAVVLLSDAAIPFIVLGSGSNVLISDSGYRGVVLINQASQVRFHTDDEGAWADAESGANLGLIARQAGGRGLSGLEWAAGIPGTLGGAVCGNAGAHGSDMAACLVSAEVLRAPSGVVAYLQPNSGEDSAWRRETWTAEDLEYTYRSSRLKRAPGSGVVLSAKLRLQPDAQEAIQGRMEEYLNRRRKTQPNGPSLGSIFRNPPGESAGRLIEACGLKGERIGGIQISALHANFFINDGRGCAEDVCELIHLVQRRVAEKFGITLVTEVEWIGEWTACKKDSV